MYCFLVEKCILNCLNDHNEICPSHGSMSPRFMMSPDGIARMLYIAPEILFSDLDTNILIGPADTLTLVKLIGKGAFGEVYQGKLRRVRIHSKKSMTTCLCQVGKKSISQLFFLLRCWLKDTVSFLTCQRSYLVQVIREQFTMTIFKLVV